MKKAYNLSDDQNNYILKLKICAKYMEKSRKLL